MCIFGRFFRIFVNLTDSIKEPFLTPFALFISYGSLTQNRTELAGFGVLNSDR